MKNDPPRFIVMILCLISLPVFSQNVIQIEVFKGNKSDEVLIEKVTQHLDTMLKVNFTRENTSYQIVRKPLNPNFGYEDYWISCSFKTDTNTLAGGIGIDSSFKKRIREDIYQLKITSSPLSIEELDDIANKKGFKKGSGNYFMNSQWNSCKMYYKKELKGGKFKCIYIDIFEGTSRKG